MLTSNENVMNLILFNVASDREANIKVLREETMAFHCLTVDLSTLAFLNCYKIGYKFDAMTV